MDFSARDFPARFKDFSRAPSVRPTNRDCRFCRSTFLPASTVPQGKPAPVIQASLTVALGLPKIGFFLKDGWNFVGELQVADFGLPQEFIDRAEEEAFFPDWSLIKRALPRIRRNRHKYQAGFVIGYAGSKNFSGAAYLAALGALRGGAGIVKLFYPPAMQTANAPYEVIHLSWTERDWNEALAKAHAVFIGPGLGRSEETKEWLEKRGQNRRARRTGCRRADSVSSVARSLHPDAAQERDDAASRQGQRGRKRTTFSPRIFATKKRSSSY